MIDEAKENEKQHFKLRFISGDADLVADPGGSGLFQSSPIPRSTISPGLEVSNALSGPGP